MSRPKNMNDMGKESIEKNFLEENPEIPIGEKVVVAKSIPKMENITFLNMRDPGVTLHFHYASASHPLKHYDLVHGMQYLLDVEVIKHLEGENKADPHSCHERLYTEGRDQEGKLSPRVSSYKPYFQCRPVRA